MNHCKVYHFLVLLKEWKGLRFTWVKCQSLLFELVNLGSKSHFLEFKYSTEGIALLSVAY